MRSWIFTVEPDRCFLSLPAPTNRHLAATYSPLFNQQRAIPRCKLPDHRHLHQEREFGVIAWHDAQEPQVRILANALQHRADVSGEQIHKGSMLAFALEEHVMEAVAETRAEIMKWRKLMAAPWRKPIGPTQKELSLRGEDFVDGLEELLWLGEVLVDVGANDKIVLAEGSEVIPVNIDPVKGRAGNLG